MSLWMFPTLEKREDMTIQRYTKLNQKYWYRDNVLGKKKYKREAKNPFGKSKQIWADNYSEWGAKKDDWIELQQSIHETGLSHNELMSLGAITIEELSNEWIYKISPTRVKDGTVEKRESNYKNLIMNSPLAKAKLVDIDSRHINRYFKTLESYNEKSRAKDYLNPLFDYAIEKEIIASNPIPKKVLKAMAQEEKLNKANRGIDDNYNIIFDDEEMQYLYNQAQEFGKDVHIPIALMMYNGMRISEALAIQVKNVDLKRGTIQVTKQTMALNKKKHGVSRGLVPPKTKNSVRTFPLAKEVAQIVLDGRYSSKDEFLFSQSNGDYALKNNWTKTYMNKLLKSLGWIDKFQKPNHDLRKYYGSKKILERVPNHVTAKWMGTSVPVLEETYAKELATVEKSYYQTNFDVTNGVTNAI